MNEEKQKILNIFDDKVKLQNPKKITYRND